MKFLAHALIIITAFATLALGRADTPYLVDEFGLIGCDEMLARIDNFSNELRKQPTARGVVIVTGSPEKVIKKVRLEVLFTSGSIQRHVDQSRVTVVRGDETGDAIMRFYLIPVGARFPDEDLKPWELTIPAGTRPFYFFSDVDPICFYPTLNRYLGELLAMNPGLRINVVVNASTARQFRRDVSDIQGSFPREYSHRLQFFQRRNPNSDSHAEYWLLP